MSSKDAKFTEGPYVIDGYHEKHGYAIRPTHSALNIAHVIDYSEADGEWAEAKATAHLIAAAPDLYAALEAALDACQGIGNLWALKAAVEKGNAALAAARGETPPPAKESAEC